MPRWIDISRTPPWAVTALYIVSALPWRGGPPFRAYGGDGWLVTASSPNTLSAVYGLAFLVWLFALRLMSTQRSAVQHEKSAPKAAFVMALLVAIMMIPLGAGLYNWNGQPPNIVLLGFTAMIVAGASSTFALMWWAAAGLVQFERVGNTPSARDILPTFSLILILPFGIWFLESRIKRLLPSPTQSPA